jgi:MazG family protein
MTHALPPIERLRAVMARLRHKTEGCPWDVEQNFATIAPYTIEEAYEVADAIERNDMPGLREELGDLLFQVVFHTRIAEEAGLFNFDDVAADLADKMIRRHPHVFGDASIRDSADQTVKWEAQKAAERASKSAAGALDGVPVALPALTRAHKIQKRASRVGFDWGEPLPALAKIEEEVGELRAELVAEKRNAALVEEEIGDLLFACVNVARLADVDPETALRHATAKFERRFRSVEKALAARGKQPQESTLAEMDALWDEAKLEEKQGARD